MSNIADLIEAYILRRLSAEENSKVELRRTDIADEISCAPSQISYVLNTRFTLEKGFTVESRRGLGGFIRIAKVPVQSLIYQEMIDRIEEGVTYEEINVMVRYLLRHRMIENREAALIMQFLAFADERLPEKERKALARSIVLTLENFS